jgi:uncharacterized protein with von Willebrand factor type A (vWA) domain
MNAGRDMTSTRSANGGLADGIVHFARILRKAGMRVGPAMVRDAVEAVLAAGIGSREDFYWTLHPVLVNRREDHATFDEAFRRFFRPGNPLAGLLAPVANARNGRQEAHAAGRRVAAALGHGLEGRETNLPESSAGFSASLDEGLREKDFAQMTAGELGQARAAIAALEFPGDRLRTRRFRPDRAGRRADPRAMMRRALRTGGELVLLSHRSPRLVQPPIVVLADISGSMSDYSRIFLHFLHALMERRRRVFGFVFGTRMTNVTRQLRNRDPDEALAQCAEAVGDWSGGTRIGAALGRFNRRWSRRVLGQGATVILITDGLERDDPAHLGEEMERLHKSCRRLIWLNPLLRFDGFEPRAGGVRAMMAHVDDFRPVHSLKALADLCAALDAGGRGANIRRAPRAA